MDTTHRPRTASLAIHRTPSAGSVIKKMHEINAALSVRELGELLRQAMTVRGSEDGEYAGVEVIDEAKALALARATLRSTP